MLDSTTWQILLFSVYVTCTRVFFLFLDTKCDLNISHILHATNLNEQFQYGFSRLKKGSNPMFQCGEVILDAMWLKRKDKPQSEASLDYFPPVFCFRHISMFDDVIIRYRHKIALIGALVTCYASAYNEDDLVGENRAKHATLMPMTRLCLQRVCL